MRQSSRKTMSKKEFKFSSVSALLGLLVVLGFFGKGCFSDEQPALLTGKQADNSLAQVGTISLNRNILDRSYRELAVTFMLKSLYARPLEILDIDKTAGVLAKDLELDEKKLGNELKSERSFFWLGRRMPESLANTILKRGMPGIYAVEEAQRFYPARRSGAHVVGFTEENSGLAGLEFQYDHLLRPGSSSLVGAGDIGDGHLQLSLDLRIQKLLEGELGELLRKTEAAAGAGIVMNIKSGAILAMVSLPDYDPNCYWDSSSLGRENRAVAGNVAVGGFNYLFGRAAAYERDQDEVLGQLASLKKELLLDSLPKSNAKAKWFEQSNDDMLSPELGGLVKDGWPEDAPAPFTDKLGLYQKSGIDLPENSESAASPTGQTSPIRLLTAFAPLVNGGTGVTPYLGEAIIEPLSGRRTIIEHPLKPGLIKPLTSKKIMESLQEASRSRAAAIFLESMRRVEAPAKDSARDENREGGQGIRYQAVMIGFTPNRESGFALLLALDQAVVDINKKTLLRSAGEGMIGRVLSLADEKVAPPSLAMMRNRAKLIYEDWLQQGQKGSSKEKKDVARHAGQGVMPDLRGLSLRKALRNLQQSGLKIKIVGSGRVVAQEPRAGRSFTGGECLLTLQADN